MVPSLLATSDVLGTGWFAADAANVKPGKTVAVVGDGAVGLLGVLAAKQMGAERIIAVSRHEARQKLARRFGASDVVTERGDEGIARRFVRLLPKRPGPGVWGGSILVGQAQGQLAPRVHPELCKDARQVELDRLGAHHKLCCRLPVGEPGTDETGHSLLLGGELGQRHRGRGGGRQPAAAQLLLAPFEEGASPERKPEWRATPNSPGTFESPA